MDALTEQDPIRSWEPITMRVTDEWIARPREEDAAYPADVQLSTQLERMPVDMTVSGYDPSTLPAERHNGVVVDPEVFPEEDEDTGSSTDRPSIQLHQAFERNRNMGHSAASVVAMARTAGELSYSGLPREPLLWIGLTGAMGALTFGAGLPWARAVRAVSELRRRFRLARARVARVVLDLEALEVSVLALPEDRRPSGSAQDWNHFSGRALFLLQREEILESGLRRPTPRTVSAVDRYADAADRLTEDAAALAGTAEVRGGFAGAGDVLDRASPQPWWRRRSRRWPASGRHHARIGRDSRDTSVWTRPRPTSGTPWTVSSCCSRRSAAPSARTRLPGSGGGSPPRPASASAPSSSPAPWTPGRTPRGATSCAAPCSRTEASPARPVCARASGCRRPRRRPRCCACRRSCC